MVIPHQACPSVQTTGRLADYTETELRRACTLLTVLLHFGQHTLFLAAPHRP